MKIIIISGGYLPQQFLREQMFQDTQMIICADGGANALYLAELIPDVLLGDFDSIDGDIFHYFIEKGVKTVTFSAEKDFTDTEIAIEYAIKLGAREVILLGATGTRLDHTLANIFLIEKYLPFIKLTIIDPNNRIELLKDICSKEFFKDQYTYLSLVPLSNKVRGVWTKGLKYPLYDAQLKRKSSYGISNEITDDRAFVKLSKGVLAVILSKD